MENENNKVEIYLNYKRSNKWLGIIDYKSLIVMCIYILIIVTILKFLPINFEYLVYIFIFLVIPVVALILINVGNESAVDTLIVIFKFLLNNNIFIKKEYIKKLDNEMYQLYK